MCSCALDFPEMLIERQRVSRKTGPYPWIAATNTVSLLEHKHPQHRGPRLKSILLVKGIFWTISPCVNVLRRVKRMLVFVDGRKGKLKKGLWGSCCRQLHRVLWNQMTWEPSPAVCSSALKDDRVSFLSRIWIFCRWLHHQGTTFIFHDIFAGNTFSLKPSCRETMSFWCGSFTIFSRNQSDAGLHAALVPKWLLLWCLSACFSPPIDYQRATVVRYLLFRMLNETQFLMMPNVCCECVFYFFPPPSTIADEGAWTQSRHLWLRAGRCWLIDCEGKCERFNTQRQIWGKPVCACCLSNWLIWLSLPPVFSVFTDVCVRVCVSCMPA